MIKFSIDENGDAEIEIGGTPFDVVSEITYLIRDVYSHYLAVDEKIAKGFRITMKSILADNDGPVWKAHEVSKEGITVVEIRVPDQEG
jgi:hypothetical protein